MSDFRYVVKTFRDAGLTAKWDKTYRGQPFIKVCDPNSCLEHERRWWVVDVNLFDLMKKHGIREGFTMGALVGDIFSLPVY